MRDLEFESTDSKLMLTTMLKIPEPTNHSFNDFCEIKFFYSSNFRSRKGKTCFYMYMYVCTSFILIKMRK